MRRTTLVATMTVALVAGLAAPGRGATTSDTYSSLQWGLDKIQAEQAWLTTQGAGALVAVVDTGVDLDHPDLAANLVTYPDADMVEPNGTCTGKKRVRTCTQDGAQDKHGHGTHVAGIIAAVTNNGTGVAGVAPAAKVLPVRVLDADGSGTTDQVAAGVRYAADKGADVINLSLGFLSGLGQVVQLTGGLEPIYEAITYASEKMGAVVVVAAGNDAVPLCSEPSAHSLAVCVGATDSRDIRSFYSNSDATMSSAYLVAPGGDAVTCSGDILSTYLRSEPQSGCRGIYQGYEYLAGTSMATPHVAGVAALLAAQGRTNKQIVDILTKTADDLGLPGPDSIYGYGRVNAAKAVAVAA